MFDPERLESEAGRAELSNLARTYYTVIHDAIRRYDPHHLILGDRYEANAPLPMEIVEAAKPYVDVFSFQDFRDPVGHLADWYDVIGKPVLWADGSHNRERIEDETGTYRRGAHFLHDGKWFADAVAGLLENPGAVGAHLCGAYIRNRYRGRGLVDEQERPDEEAIRELQRLGRVVERWLGEFGK